MSKGKLIKEFRSYLDSKEHLSTDYKDSVEAISRSFIRHGAESVDDILSHLYTGTTGDWHKELLTK